MSQGHPDDLKNTMAELKERSGLANGKNWLRHSGQAQRIDEMLLIGATVQDVALDLINAGLFTKSLDSAKARVQTHIFHLRTDEHKVPVQEDANGVWKFTYHPLCTDTRNKAKNISESLNHKSFFPMRAVSNTTAKIRQEFDPDDIKI